MRLVQRGLASYEEIRTFWDINEVMRANELLDIHDDAEWMAAEEAKRKARSPSARGR